VHALASHLCRAIPQQRAGSEAKATPVVQSLMEMQIDRLCRIAGQRSMLPHRLFVLRGDASREGGEAGGLQRMVGIKRDGVREAMNAWV